MKKQGIYICNKPNCQVQQESIIRSPLEPMKTVYNNVQILEGSKWIKHVQDIVGRVRLQGYDNNSNLDKVIILVDYETLLEYFIEI